MMSLLLGLCIWVLLGWGVLRWGGRARGHAFRRTVGRRVVAVGSRVAVKVSLTPPIKPAPPEPIDVVLLLDRSASMGVAPGSPLATMLRAARNFVSALHQDSRVAVISFDDQPAVHCDLSADRSKALAALGEISPGGGTAIAAALEKAADLLPSGRPDVRKIVLLCSDGQDVVQTVAAAAERLRRDAPVRVLCIGFGDEVADEVFLAAVETAGDYFRVRKIGDMIAMFERLNDEVSGRRGELAILTEEVSAQGYFNLSGDTRPHAASDGRRMTWSLGTTAGDPDATYEVEAVCAGWRRLLADPGHVEWVMPDGDRQTVIGPASPRILVLPKGLGWTWPIFNPLAMVLFAKLFSCRQTDQQRRTRQRAAPPASAIPPLPPPPLGLPWMPAVAPTLVIGLGASGEAVVSALKFRLADRLISPETAKVLTVSFGRPPPGLGHARLQAPLAESEVVVLQADMRPRLEAMRSSAEGAESSWMPVWRWLGETRPSHTFHGVDDRAKARFAMLVEPDGVETALADALENWGETKPQVLLVGCADDPEASGLLAETAHICAGHSASVTAVLAAPGTDPATQADVLGLSLELERLLSLRGEAVFSERREGVVADRLFDNCIMVGQRHDTESERQDKLLETAFSLIVDDGLRAVLTPLSDANVHLVECRAMSMPHDTLWQWAKARCLREIVLQDIFGMVFVEGAIHIQPPSPADICASVDRFWKKDGPSVVITLARRLALLQGDWGTDEPQGPGPGSAYHEWEGFCEEERSLFVEHLHRWAMEELAEEHARGACGITILRFALAGLCDQFRVVGGHLNGFPSGETLESVSGGLAGEFVTVMRRFLDNIDLWLDEIGGGAVSGRGGSARGLAARVGEDETRAWERLSMFKPPEEAIKSCYSRFRELVGEALGRQFVFTMRPNKDGGMALMLAGSNSFSAAQALAELLDGLDVFRPMVNHWPTADWFSPFTDLDPSQWRISGRFASSPAEADGSGGDPFRISAFRIEQANIRQALGQAGRDAGSAHFAWAEDANAARIGELIRTRLEREPLRFSPQAATSLGSPRIIVDLAREMAAGAVTMRQGHVEICRSGRAFRVARAGGDDWLPAMIRQVKSGRCLDGQALPPADRFPAPLVGDELARAAIEALPAPLGRDEGMWGDVISGASLDCLRLGGGNEC